MKTRKVLFVILAVSISLNAFSNAVAIVDATAKKVLQLNASTVSAEVNNQVAVVTSTQVFYNQLNETVHIKYAFPLYQDASAVGLRWKINGTWYTASFSPEPADTTLPGGGGGGSTNDPDLVAYLGNTPLYFDLEDSIAAGSFVTFELTYVQLLPYAYNVVSFEHPNNYSLIQTAPLDTQLLSIHILSGRIIDGIDLISHAPDSISYTTTEAFASCLLLNQSAAHDYYLEFTLNPDDLGLIGFSTFLPDTMSVCDESGNGFFAFIVEPDPGDSVIIQKVFTLIIDHSGSMSGDKMEQAKDAAVFIVNNLNFGDKFNIISFDDQVNSLFSDHKDVNLTNQNLAINYINTLYAGGGTNISGAFGTAIPQFNNSNGDISNAIIFLTDGQATAGITETGQILSYVSTLIASNEVEGLSINTFGIGYDVNTSLLSQLASQNNGLATFFDAGDLLDVVSNFYLSIQSPVLLNTSMTFNPNLVSEAFPVPLPNLYIGHQLIVVGRYDEPGSVNVTFKGLKYGDTVIYNYSLDLTDTLSNANLFLTKLWAIDKINNEMIQYYALDPASSTATVLKEKIIALSLCYGVISPFTSFTGNTGGGGGVLVEEIPDAGDDARLQNYPNPFRTTTTIQFSVTKDIHQIVSCSIMNAKGEIIRLLEVYVGQNGNYQFEWDGKDASGREVIAGYYPFTIKIGEQAFSGVMEKL